MAHRIVRATAGVALLVALLLVLGTPLSHAQRTLSLRVEGGVPTGDFDDRVEDIGFGVAGQLLFQPQGVPVALGFEGSFLNYGRQVDTVPVLFTDGGTSIAEQVTHNNISSLGLVLRLQPNGGAFQPYVEGFGGFNYVHTRVSLDETVIVNDGGVFDDSDPVVVTRNTGNTVVDDLAFTYGGGGGFLIRVFDGLDDGHPVEAYLDFGARYLLGNEADYLVEADDVDGDTTTSARAPIRTTVDVIRPYFGLSFRF